jgi:Ran GTPase-activating protein (RanGAP) involved in mRNA processing and transport
MARTYRWYASLVAQVRANNPKLENVDCIECPIHLMRRLCSALEQNTVVQSLSITGNTDPYIADDPDVIGPTGIDSEGLRILSRVLTVNRTLKSIDLCCVKFGIDDIQTLTTAIAGSTSLEAIGISYSVLTPDDWTFLTDALRHNSSIRSLRIRTHQIDADGFRILTDVLTSKPLIRSLNFSQSIRDSQSMNVIMDFLAGTTSIVELDLSESVGYNIERLCGVLRSNTGLRSLRLRSANRYVSSFRTLIRNGRYLTSLDLSNNTIALKSHDEPFLIKYLVKSGSISMLNLCNNPISDYIKTVLKSIPQQRRKYQLRQHYAFLSTAYYDCSPTFGLDRYIARYILSFCPIRPLVIKF